MQTTSDILDRSAFYGGIFREELAQQLLHESQAILCKSFQPLYETCVTKVDGANIYRKCMATVSTWSDHDFSMEAAHQSVALDTFVRASFISFVRQSHVDPSGQSRVQVRLSIPPTKAFIRELFRAFSQESQRSRRIYFEVDLLTQKDILMGVIRSAFAMLAKEFVFATQLPVDASDTSPEVEACDSISNVPTVVEEGSDGGETVSNLCEREPSTAPPQPKSEGAAIEVEIKQEDVEPAPVTNECTASRCSKSIVSKASEAPPSRTTSRASRASHRSEGSIAVDDKSAFEGF